MPATAVSVPPVKTARYLSLDVLRGLTIALMIVVNTPGSWANIYAPFRHAEWHGFTLTDLVFPTFLFVVGNAMSFSMKKFSMQEDSVFLKKVLSRTLLIFGIGLLLNYYPFVERNEAGDTILKDITGLRIMGVLQRIALCYFIASLVVRYFKQTGAIIFGAFTLLAYWAVMYYFGTGADRYSLEGNAALRFDQLLIADKNLYRGFGIPFDPEGLLSTLPAVVNVIAGYVAGIFIQKATNKSSSALRLIISGTVLIAAALLWNTYFPINKPIWTSSYVLHTVGLDLLILAALIFVIEVAGFRRWAYFFEAFGKNPLFIYIMAGAVIKTVGFIRIGDKSLQGWVYDNLFLSWAEGKNASLLFALFYMLLMWLMAYVMDKKKLYVKV